MKTIHLKPLWLITLCLWILAGCSQDDTPSKVDTQYRQYCFACHGTGAAGAPKSGDAAAWKPRLLKGEKALLKSVTEGMVGMPAKGRCMECTADDFKALIEKMTD